MADSAASKDAGRLAGRRAATAGRRGGERQHRITVNGATGYVSPPPSRLTVDHYSVETWFKTTSTTGGKIIGFGDQQGGLDFNGNPTVSGAYDKQIYMTNDGRLAFGVWVGFADTLTSATAYNDGQWHHVVGSQGRKGLNLYVDGAKVAHDGQTHNQAYTGYWRVGGDNLGGWPNQPTSNFFDGSLDETAVYDHPLTLAAVQSHYAASGRTPPPSAGADRRLRQGRLQRRPGELLAAGRDRRHRHGRRLLRQRQHRRLRRRRHPGRCGALGAIGHAVTFDGSTGNVASTHQIGGPSRYSAELWFKTTTTSGGKLIGFGNAQTGNSGNYDKQVYLTNDGRLVFGVYNGGFDTITTPTAYNDGQWHHLVASQGPAGMAIYVDDQLVGSNAGERQPGLQRLLAGGRRQPQRLAGPAQQRLLRRRHRRGRDL